MARRRRIPIPILIVGLATVAAVLVFNRQPPPERVAAFSATTPLEAPVRGLEEAWPWAERVLAETTQEFFLRTVVVDVPVDREAPPRRLLLGFRSADNDRDFTMTFRNPELELVVSQAFPTPPRMRELPAPGVVDPASVRIPLRRAVQRADSVMAGRWDAETDAGIEVDAVLRSTADGPEWRISYARVADEEARVLGTVVIHATDGRVRMSGDSIADGTRDADADEGAER